MDLLECLNDLPSWSELERAGGGFSDLRLGDLPAERVDEESISEVAA